MSRNEELLEAVRPLMQSMAEGSSEALFELVEQFRPELERVVGGILRSLHRPDVARSPSHVGSLAVSAGFVLFKRARGWRGDGALPWVWAYRSIREEIVRDIGHPSIEFDPLRYEAAPARVATQEERVVDLRDLATRHDGVASWVAAVDDVANERDRAVHLEYQVQKWLGDPSPALTVAAMFDLTPANVRQIDRRVRARLEGSPHATRELVTALSATA